VHNDIKCETNSNACSPAMPLPSHPHWNLSVTNRRLRNFISGGHLDGWLLRTTAAGGSLVHSIALKGHFLKKLHTYIHTYEHLCLHMQSCTQTYKLTFTTQFNHNNKGRICLQNINNTVYTQIAPLPKNRCCLKCSVFIYTPGEPRTLHKLCSRTVTP
jgi:hypothetical protein